MKKRILGLITLIAMLTVFISLVHAAEIAEEGECGKNITWTLDSEGTLTISGEGEMANRSWRYCNEDIKKGIISDGVTNIVEKAFYNCTNIDSVVIPDSVTKIGNAAFNYTAYYNNKANWDNGVLYSGKYVLDAKRSEVNGTCIIKDGTVCIADAAFYNCSNMTGIIMPDTITKIAYSAFENCSGLTEVEIPKGITHIDGAAFAGCGNLTKVTLSDSVTNIGNDAFYDCISLADIKFSDNLKYIGKRAFRGCRALSEITLPDDLSYIESNAFIYTAYYENDTNWQNDMLYIGNHLIDVSTEMKGCLEIPYGTKCIANAAFMGVSDIKTIKVPASVIGIGDSSFCYSGVENIIVDDNNLIYTSVNGNLFNKDKTVLIQYAEGKKDTEYTIPDEVVRITQNAFDGYNDTLKSIYVSENNTEYSSQDGVLFDKDKTHLIKYPANKKEIKYIVPSSVTSIYNDAFCYNKNLTSLVLPENLEELNIFIDECYSLRAVFVPSNIESITDGVFPEKNLDIYFGGDAKSWEWLIEMYRGDMENTTVHYEATDIPDALIGEFDAPQNNGEGKSMITVPFECIPYNCTVIAAFYSDGVMTGISSKTAKSSDTAIDFEVNTAADHARVFIWNDAEKLYPVGEAKWDKTH